MYNIGMKSIVALFVLVVAIGCGWLYFEQDKSIDVPVSENGAEVGGAQEVVVPKHDSNGIHNQQTPPLPQLFDVRGDWSFQEPDRPAEPGDVVYPGPQHVLSITDAATSTLFWYGIKTSQGHVVTLRSSGDSIDVIFESYITSEDDWYVPDTYQKGDVLLTLYPLQSQDMLVIKWGAMEPLDSGSVADAHFQRLR
jgi:hypothetical protein